MADMTRVDKDVDDQVLSLRRQRKDYRSIAQTLGLTGASEANKAFNRAMRRLPDDERNAVRSEEEGKLDRLAAATRANESFTKDEIERRVGIIDRLRARLNAS